MEKKENDRMKVGLHKKWSDISKPRKPISISYINSPRIKKRTDLLALTKKDKVMYLLIICLA
jgi:hypothetical protein